MSNVDIYMHTSRFIISANYISSELRMPWIGYDDIAREGRWVWADGGATNVTTTRWNTNEPNSYKGRNEDCAHLDDKSRYVVLMNDNSCNERQSYICEINLDDF